MPKNAIPEWDDTAIDNSDVGGIPLAENVMRPPAVNNAFREIMKQVADLFGTALSFTAAQQGRARANLGIELLGGSRNRLINGDFDIWQRSTSTTSWTGYFAADRWRQSGSSSGLVATLSRQAFTAGQTAVPGNPRYFLRFARTTVGAGTSHIVEQRIEGVRTLSGKKATVTAYVKGTAGKTISTSLTQSFGTGGSPSADIAFGSTSTVLTTSWQRVSIVVDVNSISGKTLGAAGNDFLAIQFTLASGEGVATLDVAHVSIVEGDASAENDPFGPRAMAQEFALCQRYFESTYPADVALGAIEPNGPVRFRAHGTAHQQYVQYVLKRAAPTVTVYSSSTGTAAKARDISGGGDLDASAVTIGDSGATVLITSSVDLNAMAFHVAVDAEL